MAGPSIEHQEARRLADSRLREIDQVRGERVGLQTEIDRARYAAAHPSDDLIAETGLFKSLMVQVSYFKAEAKEAKSHFDELADEANKLREGRHEFEDKAVVSSAFARPASSYGCL